MNLLEGRLEDGIFVTDGGREFLRAGRGDRAKAILGIRPEDIEVVPISEDALQAVTYATENTGESILVTAQFGRQRITCKGSRYLKAAINEPIGLRVNSARTYLFDSETGERVREVE